MVFPEVWRPAHDARCMTLGVSPFPGASISQYYWLFPDDWLFPAILAEAWGLASASSAGAHSSAAFRRSRSCLRCIWASVAAACPKPRCSR